MARLQDILVLSIVATLTQSVFGQGMWGGNMRSGWNDMQAGGGWGNGLSRGWGEDPWGGSSHGWKEQEDLETVDYTPTSVTCQSADKYGNTLEVVITRPESSSFHPFGWRGQPQTQVEFHYHIASATLDGEYELVVTELSTDYSVCKEEDVGYIVEGQQRTPNLGIWGMWGRQTPKIGGIIDEVTLMPKDSEEETVDGSRAFNNIFDFRGRGVVLCEKIETREEKSHGGWGMWAYEPRETRKVCAMPVLCCKLGLSASEHA